MKMYEVVKCKRQALGWSQTQLAEFVGVSPSTVSNYENGEYVSVSVDKNFKYSIDEYINRMSDIDRYQTILVANCLGLQYQSLQERLRTLSYILITIGNLTKSIMNTLNGERFL